MVMMIFGPKTFFYHEGDNVLRDQMGFIFSKDDFFEMVDRVYDTYKNIDQSEIDKVNAEIREERRRRYERVMDSKPKQQETAEGYVYFVRADDNFTKVGSTTNLESRYKSLKTTSPHDLQMQSYIKTEDCRGLENEIHKLLKDGNSHVKGEWFDINKEDEVAIELLLLEKELKLESYEEA